MQRGAYKTKMLKDRAAHIAHTQRMPIEKNWPVYAFMYIAPKVCQINQKQSH